MSKRHGDSHGRLSSLIELVVLVFACLVAHVVLLVLPIVLVIVVALVFWRDEFLNLLRVLSYRLTHLP